MPLSLAADQADQIGAQQARLSIDGHKVKALNRITNARARGSATICQAAKDLQLKPLVFINWLREHR